MKEKSIINELGFTSSDKEIKVAQRFATNNDTNKKFSLLFHIESICGRYIKFLSLNPIENEVLFAPNTQFLIAAVKKISSFKYTIYMEEVNCNY